MIDNVWNAVQRFNILVGCTILIIDFVSARRSLLCSNVESVIFFQIVHPEHLRFSYESRLARNFGADFIKLYEKIQLVLSDPFDGCSPFRNGPEIKNAIALVLRGSCSFVSKAVQAEIAGAAAVLISDKEVDDSLIEMIKDETGRNPQIPVLYLPGIHGRRLRNHLIYEKSPILIRIPLNFTWTPLYQANRPPWELW